MKNRLGILFAGIIVIIAAAAFVMKTPHKTETETPEKPTEDTQAILEASSTEPTPPVVSSNMPATEILAENLDIPWDIAFLPDGSMLVSERPGNLFVIQQGKPRIAIDVPDVRHVGEGGLLGITLHPNFKQNKLLYLYVTTDVKGEFVNQVLRYKLENNTLSNKEVILANIPGAQFHDGGRIQFGPDGMLYITTGDARDEDRAQDKKSLGGKILRVREDGSIPADNPFGSEVYSYGHRNPQGIVWDENGTLWETEHGRTTATLTGMDEVNLIEKGKNYGWPIIEGDKTAPGMEVPKRNSGANDTWAPASAAYLNGSLFFGGLRGEALYEATIVDNKVTDLKEHFKKEFGRIRVVRVGPDGMLYISTSNQDGRGTVQKGDDKIIRINPSLLK